ncbi:MAG: rhodanese-like domain-containing protein [Chloroflexota bacterium]
MKKVIILAFAFAVLLAYGTVAPAQTDKARILKPCSQCHKPEDKTLRGMLGNVSQKAETFSINAGAVWNVKFDDNTKVIGWDGPLHKIPKEKEVAVKFVDRDGAVYAESVTVKPPARLSPEKLLTVEQMADHVEKGDAVIVDSRPAPRFNEGAIPGAINIYDAEFDKHVDKLPKDKNQLLIFYCQGPT